MNHVEERIAELVARLHPETFSALESFRTANEGFQDDAILTFDREIQFYVAYLEHIAPLRNAGLKFCYPRVSRGSKEVFDYDGFDPALAGKRVAEGGNVVCNDFHLKDPERIIVVSGPNQGGKTTFARAFGQLHYLGRLGCPVPGTRAQLLLFDRLFTHFEKEESIDNLHGKLQDDLVVAKTILLSGPANDLETISYRQDVLRDCLEHPAVVREIYALAGEPLETGLGQDRYDAVFG